MPRWARLLGPLAGVLFFGLALWALQYGLREYRYQDVLTALRELPPPRLAMALALTAAGYAVLVGYDRLAFQFVGRALPLRRIALASFIGYAFGNNIGHTLLAGATARYWFYTSVGVSAADVARIAVFCSLGFWLGYFTLAAAAFTLEPVAVPEALHLPLTTTRPLGLALLALLVAYGMLGASRRGRVRLGGWNLELPSPRLTAGQLAVGTADLGLMSAALWVLLPAELGLSYLAFLPVFLVALAAGAASQVPGGLGVFEATLLLLIPHETAGPELVGALLAFRGIYCLLPLLIAATLIALHAVRARPSWLRTSSEHINRWLGTAVPEILALATFVAGALLVFSGALPAAEGRLAWLVRALPLPLIEASHFLGSVAGMALLVLARGLQRRLDAAYLLTLALLAAGIVLSLGKGLDYEEAIVLALILALLAASRRYFYRRASLLALPLTRGWVASIAIVALGSLWLYGFGFRHAQYVEQPWWHFALYAEAPRALRATVGAIALGVLFAAARLLRPAQPPLPAASEEEIERARPIIERSPNTYANLVLRGDKALLFSRAGNAFLMYGRLRRSWIAMGDSIGSKEEARELAWQFRDLCDRHGAWPVFFEVGAPNLDLYLDLGLALTKLGEEARVALPQFDLQGPARSGLRQGHARALRQGCRFEILPREAVPPALPELERISQDWLAAKATREKGFSNASFNVTYLRQFPAAVVRRGARLVAFANLWLGAEKEELSVDLMRHAGDAPNGAMDFLFAELMLWGRQQGYHWFNLGTAPLSGLEEHAGAPMWHRFGHLVYQYGEHFYNFRGLRQYKEKFHPVWTPRYLASPGGLALPAVLVDVTGLIAGGFAGILAR